MAEIIEVLQELGELAHWTQLPASAPHGNLTCPPIIAFRFKMNPSGAKVILETAIASFNGTIAWHLSWHDSRIGQRFVIEPKRVTDLTEERGLLGGPEAAGILMDEDPEFGLQSHRELAKLADHIRTVARATPDTHR